MEPPAGRRRRRRSRTRWSPSSGRCPTPTRPTTCAGSTTATATIDGVRRATRRPRPTPRCGSRSTTGAGRACRSSSAPASTCRSTQTELRLVFQQPPRLGFRPQGSPRPEPDQLVVKLDPTTGIRLLVDAQRGDATEPEQINLDMEFAEEGGEGADALRGAAARRDDRRQHALHPPGQRRGDLADPAAAARRAAAGPRRTRRGRGARRPPTSWSPATAAGTALGGRHEPARPQKPKRRRRAAPKRRREARAERRGAVAVPADRRLRVPLQLPHRRAGRARRRDRLALRAALRLAERVRHACSTARPARSGSGRSASTYPAPRIYEPGTNILLTTWKTPTGWVLVRDALTMGPRQRRGRDHAAHPPAGRRRRRPHAGAHGPLPRGQGRGRAGLRAGLRLRPRAGRVDAGRRRPPHGRRQRRRPDDPAADRHGARHRGRPGAGPARARAGRAGLLRALLGRGASPSPQDIDEANARLAATTRFWRALARAAPGFPTTAGATRSSARRWRSRASPTCRPARPWRRSPPRCPRRPAASATGTTASPGCATRPSPSRRCTTSTSTGRPTSSCSSSPTSRRTRTARCRSCTGSTAAATSPSRRATTSPATRARSPVRIGNGAFDQRQNDVFGAVLDSILLHTRRSERLPRRLWPIVQSQAECATERLARARPGHLGGARRAAALRVVEAHVLGRAGPRRQAGRDPRRPRARARPGARPPTRSRRTSSSTASRDGVLRQHYDTDALDASTLLAAIFGFLPGDDERLRKSVDGDRRRPDRGRLRAALPHRRDRRRPVGQGGELPDLLVLARLGAGDRRRAAARPRPDGAPAAASPRRSACTPRSSTPSTGRHLGNFPQAFSHLALIEAAARIILAERLEELCVVSDPTT